MQRCYYCTFKCGDKLRAGYFDEIAKGNPMNFFTPDMVWERTTSAISQILDLTFNRLIVTTESGSQYYIILD